MLKLGVTTLVAISCAAVPCAHAIRGFHTAVHSPGSRGTQAGAEKSSGKTNKQKRKREGADYPNNPLSAAVREKLLQVIGELNRRQVPFVVKQDGSAVSVVEQGFDVIERFFSDVYPTYNDRKTAMVDSLGTDTFVTVFGEDNRRKKYRVLDWKTYEPLVLVEAPGGDFHVMSRDAYANVSHSFEVPPVPLEDGLVLYDKDGKGRIIPKTGNLLMDELRVDGPREDHGDEWGFSSHDKKILLPKSNPVGSLHGQHRYGRFRLYLLPDGRYEFRDKGGSHTPAFHGRPKDYRGSWLLDLGDGKYSLVSKRDFSEKTRNLVESPPEPKPKEDLLVVNTESGYQIVNLNNIKEQSRTFDEAPTALEHYWEGKFTYEDFSGKSHLNYVVASRKGIEEMSYSAVPFRKLEGGGLLGEDDKGKKTIYNGLDPTLASPPFEAEPWNLNGVWVSKTAKKGNYLVIAQEQPQKHSKLVAVEPKEMGSAVLLQDPDGYYLVSKQDPTERTRYYKRILRPKQGTGLGGLLGGAERERATSKWALVEDGTGTKIWVSTDTLEEQLHEHHDPKDGPLHP